MKRIPQIIKITSIVPRDIANRAWKIALDGYRTFAPLKYPPHILALGYIQLATLLHSHIIQIPYSTFAATAHSVDQVMIDLLDFYIHYRDGTHVGPAFELSTFMNLQIGIRRGLREEERDDDIPPLRDATAGDRGTVRFILDWERVARETEILEGLER
jgi:CTD kinase subunit beta